MDESIRHVIREVYCEVLFELAEEAKTVDLVMEDLARVVGILKEQAEFASILSSQAIKPQEKAGIVRRVFEGKVEGLLLDFLSVLARRNRMSFLPGISERYEMLVDVYHKRSLVEVTVAKELSEHERAKLKADLSEAIKSEVKLSVSVDPDIIGGIIIKRDDTVIDNSIKRALERAVKSVISKSGGKVQRKQFGQDGLNEV